MECGSGSSRTRGRRGGGSSGNSSSSGGNGDSSVVVVVVVVVVVGVVGTPPYQLRLLQTLLRSHPFCSVFAVLSLCPTTDRYKKLFVDLASSSFQSPGLTSGVGSGGGK